MSLWVLSGIATGPNRATSPEADQEWVVDAQAWPDQVGMLGGITPAQITELDQLLTRREQQILACLVRGGSAKEVARELFISEGTVRKHRENLRTKLGLRSTAALVAWAIERGLHSASQASLNQHSQHDPSKVKTSSQPRSNNPRRKP
jgi:DNA-binding CsgD family transcriptional regulator